MGPAAILLDLDDTLIAHDSASERAWVEVCGRFVRDEGTPFGAQALLAEIHPARRWFWGDSDRHREGRRDLVAARRTIATRAFARLGYRDAEKIDAFARAYCRLQEELIALFPDTMAALGELKSIGMRLGMITNGSAAAQRRKIDRFGLEPYFEHILVEGEVGIGKPDPEVYRIALARFALAADRVWMVGDNLEWDVAAPQSLGIFSVWNDWEGTGLPPGSPVHPNRVIRSIAELPGLITQP